jgi:hypothetical protein
MFVGTLVLVLFHRCHARSKAPSKEAFYECAHIVSWQAAWLK